MTDSNFFAKVEKLKKQKPIWFGLDSDPEATELEIKEVENTLSIKFPEEYKKFIKVYGGGDFAFTNVFSVYDKSQWNIVNLNKDLGLLKQYNFLAVSDNEAGDYYGYKVNEGYCTSQIYIFNHESNQIEATEYMNLFDFLLKVGLKQ